VKKTAIISIAIIVTIVLFCGLLTGCGVMGKSNPVKIGEISLSEHGADEAASPTQLIGAPGATAGDSPVNTKGGVEGNASVSASDGVTDAIVGTPSSGVVSQDDKPKITLLPEIDRNITATLTVTGMHSDEMDSIIRQFNTVFPNVTVVKDGVQLTDTSVSNAFMVLRTKLNTKILSGQAGDIIMTDSTNMVILFKRHILADLREFMRCDPEFNTNDYFMNIIEAFSFNGGLCVMPINYVISMLGFNMPMADGYSFANKSDVWELTQALDEAKSMVDQKGLKGKHTIFPTPDYHLFSYTLLPLNYAAFINLETGKVNIDCAEFIDILKYVKGLADTGYIISSERTNNQPEDYPIMTTGSTNGLQGMFLMDADNKPVHINMKPLTGKNGELSIHAYTILAINEHSPNKQLAWEFIKCALSYEVQSSPDMFLTPVNRAALRVFAEQHYLSEQMGLEQSKIEWGIDHSLPDEAECLPKYIELITNLNERALKYTFNDYDIDDAIYEQVYEYFEGKVSAEETAQILQRKISMIMDG